jgi:hypothetical protein
MKQGTLPKFEIDKSMVSKAREHLLSLDPYYRTEFIDQIREGFCEECGRELERHNIHCFYKQCHCMNDE